MAWKLKTLLFGLLLTWAAAGENKPRSSRQLMYPDTRVFQPTVQYYFIQKIQNGPESNRVSQAGYPENYLPQYYNLENIQQESPVPSGDPVHYMATSSDDYSFAGPYSEEEPSFRQLNLFGGLFNNRFANGNTNLNTFRPLNNKVSPIIANPDVQRRFGSCDAGNGDFGICLMGPACNMYGGQASGSCQFGMVCCVNTLTKCSGTVTLNNTYWQSPTGQQLVTPTACSLTIKLDSRLKEQSLPICQVRLDLLAFSLVQPESSSICKTDTFQVGGALNNVPTICGDNDNQHMYIHTARSDTDPGDVRLTFNFGDSSFIRLWRIKVALLPCSSSMLAPSDCLQYFTGPSGSVFSFNWKDLPPSATRKLANQNYKACFRTELINNKRAERVCFSQCQVRSGSDAFLVSGSSTGKSAAHVNCKNDFISIAGEIKGADRFCGNYLHPTHDSSSTESVCTTATPFELLYVTNNEEEGGTTNVGFCLQFQQDTN